MRRRQPYDKHIKLGLSPICVLMAWWWIGWWIVLAAGHYEIFSGKRYMVQQFVGMWAGLGLSNVGYWELLVRTLNTILRGGNV